MFRPASHHLQGELTCSILRTICYNTAIIYLTVVLPDDGVKHVAGTWYRYVISVNLVSVIKHIPNI